MVLRTLAAAAVIGLKPHTSPPLMAMNRILNLDPSSGVRRLGSPAHYPAALGRNLEQSNINSNGAADDDNLMLVVELGNKNTSLFSIENNSHELVRPNRPNFSRLNSSAQYEFLAGSDKWVVLGFKDNVTTSPAEFLWDPTTDEVRPIPQFQMKPRHRLPILDYWYNFCGVGFDSGSGDYKVVRCANLQYVRIGSDEVRGELLSIGTGSWREIRLPHHYEDMTFKYDHCIHINGFYYWPSTIVSSQIRHVIVPFDFRREEFSADFIPMPNVGMCRSYQNLVLAEYHGSLAVIFQDDLKFGEDSLWLQIWVWSNGDRSWSHLSTFHIPADVDVEEVVGLYNNDKVILVDSQGALLLYNCGTAELENFGYVGFWVYPHCSKSKRNRSS